MSLRKILSFLAIGLYLLSPVDGLAISSYDRGAVLYETVFYDPSAAAGCNTNIPSSANLSASIIDQINKNRPFYTAAAQTQDLPWQVLAAIHYRETNFGRNNPRNGQGIFQFLNGDGGPYPTGKVTDEEFQRQLTFLAEKLQNDYVKRNLELNRKRISASNINPEQIKDTFFSYNGRARAYAQQAETLGFDAQTQPYEGSPYVMNNFDAVHANMKIITKDGGGIDGTDTRIGAFTLFARLVGPLSCGISTGNDIVDAAAKEIGINEADGSYLKYTDGAEIPWCAAFVSWVYKESGSPLGGGESGWLITAVSNVKSLLQSKGTYYERSAASPEPKPGDLVFFYFPELADAGEGTGNHMGIVERVDGGTLHTIEGNTSDQVARREYKDYLNKASLVGWGRP